MATATYGPYKGETHEGLRSGKGRYKFSNAFFEYDGEWVDGVMHGEGRLKMGDGSQYEGTFESGAMSGVGMRRWPDGGTYSGQFVSGELHGEGMYISAQGDQFEGQYKNNVREGEGRLTSSKGDRYEGEFARHRMNGNGSMYYADGGVYKGEWSASMRCGNGHMVWSGGDEFEGKWEDDAAHGDGLFTHPEGYERDGEWEHSEPSTVARRAEFFPWAPPPTELTFEGAVIALSPPPAPAEGGGGDEAEPPAPAEPPLSSLTLRLVVVGATQEGGEADEATPISASTGLVEPLPNYETDGAEALGADGMGAAGEAGVGSAVPVALDPNTTCEGASKLELSMAEGVARPIRVLCELCDPANGDEAIASAEVALPLSSTGETKGTLEALPLGKVGADAEAPPYACLTIAYSAVENYHEVDETAKVEPTSAEALAELLAEPLKAASLIPPVSAVLCRTLEIEPPPADEDAEPPAAAPAKGKGKEPVPEPEPEGPILELYPVAGESGRAITVTLELPQEVGEARLAAHEQAVNDGQAAYEADLAAFEEAMAVRTAAIDANPEAAEASDPPPEPPEPYARPPEPKNVWELGTLLSKHGRLLVRGLSVPPDVPTGPATLLARETTPPLALFALPHVEEVRIPVTLLAEGDDAIPEPPPPTKGKK